MSQRTVKWALFLVVVFIFALGIIAVQQDTARITANVKQQLDNQEATHRIEFFMTRTAESP